MSDVASLRPIGRRPRWVPRSEFATTVLAHQADPALTGDIEALSP